ncbi:hypothetical protein [Nonomuraea rhodomycinica]|uniref:Uncharacterized protein n=1 Tax=Nonomuraea rhodomycinica TaxID=1712872 RepID=A0A7Y6IQ28_9ACTN|nr:hypothetical protein [Nonomuraea rhodomycinica]NUW41991.1 hypothetical protein [Nonomuraea rhodomycinica]
MLVCEVGQMDRLPGAQPAAGGQGGAQRGRNTAHDLAVACDTSKPDLRRRPKPKRAASHQLEHAATYGGTSLAPHDLKEQLNTLTALTDRDELLLRDYHDAIASGDDIQAAVTLVRIQYAAATQFCDRGGKR